MSSDRHRFAVGSTQCILLRDSTVPGKIGSLVQGVGESELEAALEGLNLRPQGESMDTSTTLFRGEGSWCLLDSGRGQSVGRTLDLMQAEGIDPAQIELVLLTHTDFDHTAGLLVNGELAFPEARFVFPRLAWESWTNPATLAATGSERAAMTRAVAAAIGGRLELAEPGAQILPDVRFLPAPGHRNGHCAVEFRSGGERFVHLADSALHLVYLRHPDWHCSYDADPERAAATRARLFAEMAAAGCRVSFTHLPFPALGRIVESEVGYSWQPQP